MSSLIDPVYTTRRANAPITLKRLPVEITYDGQLIQCNGKASLLLQPDLRLVVTADLSGSPADALRLVTASGPITLRCGSQSTPVNALLVNSTCSSSKSGTGKAEAILLPNPQKLTICPNRRKRLKSVLFHVMNFPAFFCAGDESTDVIHENGAGGLQRLGRAIFSNADWYIEIQELPNTRSLVKELRAKGGYGITHVGRLTRQDDCAFAISAAERALQELHLFLSFARGLWTPLILPVGYDANGIRIFEEWSSPLGTPWEPRSSWFDEHHGESLGMLYRGFTTLQHDPQLGKPLAAALYWYLRSNRAGKGVGVDSGIILSQAALERLSTAYLAKAGLSTGSNAADRLRRACRDLKLSTAIPKVASPIYSARRKGVWSDVPDAITKVRNELVHPTARLNLTLGKVISPTWILAQWYIELFILRLANYRGVYSDRLRARWRGEVRNVPWVR